MAKKVKNEEVRSAERSRRGENSKIIETAAPRKYESGAVVVYGLFCINLHGSE